VPQINRGCMATFLGVMGLLCLTVFGFGLANFLAHGERLGNCGPAGCRSLLVGLIALGLLGLISTFAAAGYVDSRRSR
jgi:hypothetical protein